MLQQFKIVDNEEEHWALQIGEPPSTEKLSNQCPKDEEEILKAIREKNYMEQILST